MTRGRGWSGRDIWGEEGGKVGGHMEGLEGMALDDLFT